MNKRFLVLTVGLVALTLAGCADMDKISGVHYVHVDGLNLESEQDRREREQREAERARYEREQHELRERQEAEERYRHYLGHDGDRYRDYDGEGNRNRDNEHGQVERRDRLPQVAAGPLAVPPATQAQPPVTQEPSRVNLVTAPSGQVQPAPTQPALKDNKKKPPKKKSEEMTKD